MRFPDIERGSHDPMFRRNHTITQVTVEPILTNRTNKSRRTGPRVRASRGPGTGSGRCPSQG